MTGARVVQTAMFAIFLSTLWIVAGGKIEAQPTATLTSAKMLFCVDGASGGLVPRIAPPGYDWWLAVAVVEVNSTAEVSNVAVGDFALLDEDRHQTKMRRLVQIDQFDAPLSAEKERYIAYWLNGDAHPWNGTVQKGITRLRVRVALDVPLRQFPPMATPITKNRCTVKVGPYRVEGPLNAVWPS
jgi:hypothetical protein